MKARDLTGQRFGRLVAEEKADRPINKNGKMRTRWKCRCDCGNECVVLTESLVGGRTTSCGCYRDECRKKNSYRHGLTKTRIYNIWSNMKARCYKKSEKCYFRYGGRGIKVCDEWKNDFVVFYEWAKTSGYKDDLTIERIDVNGNYCPENCCWIPANEQARNRRPTLKTTDKDGRERYVMDIAKEIGIPMNIVRGRLYDGWEIEQALYTPIIQQTLKRRVVQIDLSTQKEINKYNSIGEASRATGVDRSTISRCCLGERNKAGGYAWRYGDELA